MPRNESHWCFIGDFNEMNSTGEKNGSTPISPIRLSLFRDFLNAIDLIDLDLKGCRFT